ncbi:alpha/beta hydrolase family protein [Inhella gelatinilytica]|uniref:Acetylhydrolase n=1 Tax=Inhella gelatinilytica TaxID=2795030 RepID=A0A931IY49_9BURK|nr:hypothetical protein [Inhella gelatinilytica]MBH9553199.1 hypothetical protein [Inhella gelatinilytica]
MRRRSLLMAGAGGLLACTGTWAREEPSPREAEVVQPWRAEEWDWVDEARGRDVPVRLYLPSAEVNHPLPLVLFSHGIGGSRRGYSYLGQHLAAQGFASLHVQHVGSDRRLWTGNVFQIFSRLQDAARTEEARARAHDVRFALDRLLLERPQVVDAQRIAVAGHSYGANTSLLLAGAAIPGEPQPLADPRVRAAVFISAPPLHGVPAPERALAAIRVPSLHITATDDVIRVPGYHSTAAERMALFQATGSALKRLVVFAGGSHSVFTDRGGTGGVMANPQIKQATKEVVSEFLRGVLDVGSVDHLNAWAERHQDLLAHWAAA